MTAAIRRALRLAVELGDDGAERRSSATLAIVDAGSCDACVNRMYGHNRSIVQDLG